MTKKATNKELVDTLEALQGVITGLVQKAKGEAELEEFSQPEPPSDEEISMNLRGDPRMHIDNPAEFARLKKFYNPERQPFTNTTAFISKWAQKDTRPFKNVVIDGVEYRRTPAYMGPDVYWIERGVRDVTEKPLWHWYIVEKLTKDQKALFRANYKGGYRNARVPGHN